MAAPTIRGSVAPAIVTNGTVSVTSPAGTQVGDLCIFFLWTQGANSTTITHTLQSNFFDWYQDAHEDGTTDGRLSCCVKKATQAGAVSYSPYSVANGTASQSALGMIVLTAGTYQPNYDSVIPTLGASTVSTGNQVPNPPSVASLTGDYLVLAVAAWHVTTAGATAVTAPTNYTIEIQNAAASHVTHLAIARRALTGLSAATEDPAAYGDNVTPNGTIARTIAIRAPASLTTSIAIDGVGDFAIAAATRATAGGPVALDGGGSFVVAAATRETASHVSIDGGGALTIVDSTVTGGGPVEYFGSMAIDGGGAFAIAASTREALSSVAFDASCAVTIGAAVRQTFSSVSVDGGASLSIAAATRATSGVVAFDGGGSIVVVGTVNRISGALNFDGSSGLAVSGTRETRSLVAFDGASAVSIAVSTRETFSSASFDGVGRLTITAASEVICGPLSIDGVDGFTVVGTVTRPVAHKGPARRTVSQSVRRLSSRSSRRSLTRIRRR